jgi:hypothetical protein
MRRKGILWISLLAMFAAGSLCMNLSICAALQGEGKSVTEWPEGLTLYKPDKAFKGFTLYTSLGTDQSTIRLIDMQGKEVKNWKVNVSPGMYAHFLDNGNMLYAGRTNEGYGGETYHMSGKGGAIYEIDWGGNIVKKILCPNHHHDQCKLPNGNYLAVCWEKVPKEKLAQVKGGIPGTEFPDGTIMDDVIKEYSPDGKVVSQWVGSEHLPFDQYPIGPLDDRLESLHINSVSYLPAGNPITGTESVMISCRHISTCIIYEKATGKVQWEYGGYKGKEYGKLGNQHNFSLIPKDMPGAGNLMIFDNGTNLGTTPAATQYWGIAHSRVLEINPKDKKVAWMYEHKDKGWNFPGVEPKNKFFSGFVSGAQRLPNGNTLICDGGMARIFEVTKDNEIVWEYINPEKRCVFRAYRYPANFPAFAGKGLPATN